MSNSPGVLSRLFGRSNPAPVVSSLAIAALNRPLLAHPAMAESLIGGYLSGAITSADSQLAMERVPLAAASEAAADAPPAEGGDRVSARQIGVINIAGGLVNRPMPGPSGAGPTSYQAIRAAFDEMLSDEGVTDIVLRIESPGGMASGCFDLTDYIAASRGTKPIHALVDDYAYSAAYAIAAACDEVWVSRTGGVGSVGVCAFHHDWSGNNEQIGLKVTPIFAGARKLDFNPNLPLSEEAQSAAQASVDETYALFTESVARYRGIDVAAVRATEADVFHGQRGITTGLATRLGTWDDLVAHLGAPAAEAPERAGDNGEPEPNEQGATAPGLAEPEADAAPPAAAAAETNLETTVADAQQQRGALMDAVQASAFADDVKFALLTSVHPGEDVSARLAHAQQVIDLCAAAGVDGATAYIRKNTDIAQVSAELLEAKAKADEAVHLQTTLPAHSAQKSSAPHALDPTTIYRNRGTSP